MNVYDTIFHTLEFITENYVILYIIAIPLQMFMASRKSLFWGLICPVITTVVVLFFISGPLPSDRVNTPYMSGMLSFAWIPLTILLLIVLIICRVRMAHNKKISEE